MCRGIAMRRLLCASAIAAWFLACGLCCERAEAAVVVNIDRASQTMSVSVDGEGRYLWRVSTARQVTSRRPAAITRK
jgi:hypothetical protein